MPAAQRCKAYRRRILEISQKVKALHIGGAFSCLELVDCLYNEIANEEDTILISKGHGWMAQAVILEERGLIDLDKYGTKDGVGVHPEYGTPGIAASTGSLGHGLPMAVGMAIADRSHMVYCVISDGELQEGSTWEAILLVPALRLSNIMVLVDNNNLQSLGRTSDTHPNLYPISRKFHEFGWGSVACHGHDSEMIKHNLLYHDMTKPFALIAGTKKGHGVSFMVNQPVWHYKSPSPEEYQQALEELK